MADYRLSTAAEHGILQIYVSGFERFGEYQAEAYHEGLKRAFQLLAEFPYMGPTADELRVGLRRWRYVSHAIF